MNQYDHLVSNTTKIHYWVLCNVMPNQYVIAPQRAKRAVGHTKPLQACESYLSLQKYHLRPLMSPSLMKIAGQISPTKMRLTTKNHILRRSARTEFFCWHFYFFRNNFFKFKFMQNGLRDFQKKYKIKIDENWSFSMPISQQKK